MIMNILIVDDEELTVEDLMNDVKTIYPSASVDGCSNARSALEMAGSRDYDIALLDISMPDMDGLDLAKRMIVSSPAINIIFITGFDKYALEAHELYCSAFLMKPVGVRKLKKAFENLRKPFIDIPADFSNAHYSGSAVIGRKLEFYRKQRGISRQELADYMKVSRQTIYRWEQGERIPDVLTLARLARLLGVDIKDIIEGDEN